MMVVDHLPTVRRTLREGFTKLDEHKLADLLVHLALKMQSADAS
jgi:hypothetical protein